ncbi:YfiR family protein [Marinobacter sp. GN3S48]
MLTFDKCRIPICFIQYDYLLRGRFVRDHLKYLPPLILSLCLGMVPVHASIRSEYEVKAAFLYNFTRFVSWSHAGSNSEPLEVCVFGDDPFGDLLNPLRGRKSQGRELQLRYPDDASNLSGCNVLYIAQSQSRNLDELLDLAQHQGMLTVSDLPEFVRKGGMVGYVKKGNVIRFEINLKAATEAGLTINSRLLELAVRVVR